MDAMKEWDQIVNQPALPPMSPQDLIDVGHKAAMAAPEYRWPVIKDLAYALFTQRRMPELDTLDQYVGLVVTVTHDCVAEQTLLDMELRLIGATLDKRRERMLMRLASGKRDSSNKKIQEKPCKDQASEEGGVV